VFRRRRELAEANVPAGWAESGEWRGWPAPAALIRGETHHADVLARICGGLDRFSLLPVEVILVLEPSNPHDPNAIRAEVSGMQVGYVAREIAAQLSPPLRRAGCWRFSLAGLVRGRFGDGYTPGVHVWTDRRLSPGPEIHLAGPWLVEKWPPAEDEGRDEV